MTLSLKRMRKCRAPFGSQNTENAGFPLLKECGKCRAPIGTQNAENAGLPLAQQWGKFKAPIGSQNTGFAELPLAHRMRGLQGSHWFKECWMWRAPIGSQNAGIAGLCSCVCMEPKRNLMIKLNMKNLCFFITLVLKVHKIENFFDSDFGICVISLLVMSKY